MSAYPDLLKVRGVPRLLTSATLSRLSTSMVSLTVALGVAQIHGSVAAAGLALTAQAIAIAVNAPLAGRLADRFGPRRVLLSYLAAHAVAYVVLVTVLLTGDVVTLIFAAVAYGVTLPPAGAVLRGHWPVVVPPAQLRTAYAVDSITNSSTFVVGPPLAGLLTVLVSPGVALAFCAVTKISGDLLLATSPGLPGRSTRPSSGGKGARWLGALGDRQVRLLLCIVALDTFGYGCLDIAAVALGIGHGATAGWLMGAVAVGEVIGGLVYGARPWTATARRQLTVLHAVTAVVLVAVGAISALPLIGVFFLAAGLVGGVRDTVNQVVLTETAPAAYRTEAFAWLSTCMWLGFGLGTTVAGYLQSRLGTPSTFLAGATSAAIAATCTLAIRPAPQPLTTTSKDTAR
ncbi:MFS transporter [Kribbella sp. NPDC023855]|uniref:MFS transporter n=1 Tax=Kribbella sp. NPDC023855 TaxID=3154698 RepID=UPI0033ED0BBD